MAFPNQTYFYCKHKQVEVALKIIESKVVPLGTKDSLVIVTFQCPTCQHQFLYKMTISGMKQFLPEAKIQ